MKNKSALWITTTAVFIALLIGGALAVGILPVVEKIRTINVN